MATTRISRHRLARYRDLESRFVFVDTSTLLAEKLGLLNERGVFARVNIPKGTVLGVYYGPLYTTAEIDAKYSGSLAKYVLCSPDGGYCRDCEDGDVSTNMRLINSNRGMGLDASVRFCDRDERKDFLVRARRDIRAGEELLVDYGPEYFT